jgi:hypothetical protein
MAWADRPHQRTADEDALRLLVVTVCTLLPLAFLADFFGSQSYMHIAEALVSIAAITPNAVAIFLRRRIGRHQESDETRRGDLARPPLFVLGVLSSALLLLSNLYVAVIVFVVGFAQGFSEGLLKALGVGYSVSVTVTGGDTGVVSWANDLAALVLAVPLLLLSTYVLARRAAHYLAHHSTLWLAASVCLYVALALLVVIASYALRASDYRLILFQVVVRYTEVYIAVLPVLIFTSWLGKRRADSTHSQFVVERLFRQLGTEDRTAALDLLREAQEPPSPSAVARIINREQPATGP